jgi:hypothetical protein
VGARLFELEWQLGLSWRSLRRLSRTARGLGHPGGSGITEGTFTIAVTGVEARIGNGIVVTVAPDSVR